jgi:hypothetical protein
VQQTLLIKEETLNIHINLSNILPSEAASGKISGGQDIVRRTPDFVGGQQEIRSKYARQCVSKYDKNISFV